VILVVLLSCAAGFAQQTATPAVEANTLSVGADGKYEADPDTALVQFNIAAQEQNSKDAYDHATRAAEQVRELLRKDGIDPKSAQLSSFEFQPMYDYRDPKHKIVGYRVSSNVSVKIKDFSKISPIIQGLGDIDISGNQSLNYTLEDIDAAKQKAVQDAYRRARASAETVAQAAGRAVSDLLYASVDTFEPIRPRPMVMSMMKAEAAPAAPPPTEDFGAQKVTVTAHVNALFRMK
jgi:uncharacterized protein YggE